MMTPWTKVEQVDTPEDSERKIETSDLVSQPKFQALHKRPSKWNKTAHNLEFKSIQINTAMLQQRE